jgi:predicted RNase H-like HicB family nuclease
VTQVYPIEVFWSDEDQIWIANVPDLSFCSGHGDTPQAAVEEAGVAVEAWLEAAKELGLDVPQPSPRTMRV